MTLGASGPYRVQPKWGPTARAGLSAPRSPIRSADRRWVPCGDVFDLMNRLKAGPCAALPSTDGPANASGFSFVVVRSAFSLVKRAEGWHHRSAQPHRRLRVRAATRLKCSGWTKPSQLHAEAMVAGSGQRFAKEGGEVAQHECRPRHMGQDRRQKTAGGATLGCEHTSHDSGRKDQDWIAGGAGREHVDGGRGGGPGGGIRAR